MRPGELQARYPQAVSSVQWVRGRFIAHGGDGFIVVLVGVAAAERFVLAQGFWSAALAALWGMPLLLRRRHPVLAPSGTLALIGVSLSVAPEMGHRTGGELLLVATAVWVLAAHNRARRAAWALPAVGLSLMLADDLEALVGLAVVVAGAAVAGALYSRDRSGAEQLHGHLEQLAHNRDSALQAAAASERARIARELHDIIAHSVTVMTVQAGAARMQLANGHRQALASVAAIEDATTTALEELDRLIGLLGRETDVVCGLDDAEPLVSRMREAGLDVRLRVEGAPRPLAGGLDLTLYRILQEALTNAFKHAGRVRTDVVVGYGAEEVGLLVVNALPETTRPLEAASNRGHGLIGMRERVALYGGSLHTGANDRSFTLDVRVPAP